MPNENTIDDNGGCGSTLRHASSHRKSNKDLTDEERIAKRELKRHLKQLHRQQTIETRVRHAIVRRDPKGEEEARAELANLLLEQQQQHQNQESEETPIAAPPSAAQTVNESELERKCRTIVESTYHQLQIQLHRREPEQPQLVDIDAACGTSDDAATTARKNLCVKQTVKLLRNMTKGTLELSMFDNPHALRGYTRKKFIDRSMLVVSSLSKLTLPSSSSACNEHHHTPTDSAQSAAFFRARLIERLEGVKSVASIGCGPGCDAFGISVLLSCLPTPQRIERLVLLDWAMDQWRFIVQPLEDQIVPKYADSIDCGTCNVLKHVDDTENSRGVRLMTRDASSAAALGVGEGHCVDPDKLLSIDLFITSYLLSETRGKWSAFYDSLFHKARPGSLFLFTDPTAWQIHIWLSKYETELECHCWLDSSMNQPDLQVLEGRLGPAVLMAMKKA
jgi:hypothetical protein